MVFAAHDSTLDREVALKILSEEYSADERRISAFEEEARITASFSHPHVVRVLKTGKAFGRFFIAMELVPGGHFEHQIRERGKIPEAEMLPLAIEVAQGLKAAHAAGLIHRDVKPGNILLDAEGHAKLVDFGLALVTQGGKAQATELWATPYYVPPETIEGSAEDFRSDIYAFGATIYHALAGKPSCGEETMATDRLREAKKNVVPLGLADSSLSAETCGIVDRAMAYNPEARFSSYDDLIAKLEASLARLKFGAPSAGQVSREALRSRAKIRRNSLVLYSIGGLVLLAVAAIGVSVLTKEKVRLTQDPPPVVHSIAPAAEDDSTASIGKLYRNARAAVVAEEYETAAKLFTALSADPAVQEPTRSWAGIEAIAASFLHGNSAEARRLAQASLKHVEATPAASLTIRDSLLTTLQDLSKLTPIPANDANTQSASSAQIMAWMIGGLKNWEQGMMDASAACFKAVAAAEPSSEDAWLTHYQKIAGYFLADHQILITHNYDPFPTTAEGCREAIAALELALKSLKTKGRARFNVRALQLDLTRHAKLLEAPKQQVSTQTIQDPIQPELPTILSSLADFIKTSRFADAILYLKTLPAEPQGASRSSLLALVEFSENFFTDLENDLSNSPLTLDLTLVSGETVKNISLDALGTVLTKDAAGKEVSRLWSDFTVDSLISLHRVLVKKPASEPERLRRHQCAIAFDWLTGNRERALAAAASLAQTSPALSEQWKAISSGLPVELK